MDMKDVDSILLKEIDRMVKDAVKELPEYEKVIIILSTAAIAAQRFPFPLTTKHRRIVFEVLHNYYAMIEGLQKGKLDQVEGTRLQSITQRRKLMSLD